MSRKLWGIATLLLAGCPALPGPLPEPRLSQSLRPPASAKPLLLVASPPAPPPGVNAALTDLTGIKAEVGPKSTGPSTKGVQDIVQFFRALNLDAGQAAPNLTAQALLAQAGVRSVKAVRFALVVSLASGEKREIFAASLDGTGAYLYTQADLSRIQQGLAGLGEITAFEFVFFGPDPELAAAPLARVQPRLSERKKDDYVLECDIPDEDDDKFYEHEDESEDDSGDDSDYESEDDSEDGSDDDTDEESEADSERDSESGSDLEAGQDSPSGRDETSGEDQADDAEPDSDEGSEDEENDSEDDDEQDREDNEDSDSED